jgi:hypothetical protein
LGLKACVARQIRENEIPDRDLVNNVYTHQFAKLVALAGLARHLQEAHDIDRQFQGYWAVASEWSPDARYDMIDSFRAGILVTAIADPDHGVMKWIRQFW